MEPDTAARGTLEVPAWFLYRNGGPQKVSNFDIAVLCPTDGEVVPKTTDLQLTVPDYTPGELLWVQSDLTYIGNEIVYPTATKYISEGNLYRMRYRERFEASSFERTDLIPVVGEAPAYARQKNTVYIVGDFDDGSLLFAESVELGRTNYSPIDRGFAVTYSKPRTTPPAFALTLYVDPAAVIEANVPLEITCTVEQNTATTPDTLHFKLLADDSWGFERLGGNGAHDIQPDPDTRGPVFDFALTKPPKFLEPIL